MTSVGLLDGVHDRLRQSSGIAGIDVDDMRVGNAHPHLLVEHAS